jgi:UDP-N-acetyl-D-galactosamine dehydrogenase
VSDDEVRIGIVGLGYVGLPLAIEFARHFEVVGHDANPRRIAELESGRDSTGEVSAQQLAEPGRLRLATSVDDLDGCNVIVVTVPTPVDDAQQPDLRQLESACRAVGERLNDGDTVIFESTVYPGTTREICVPILEAASGLRCAFDAPGSPTTAAGTFTVGYSPERINPGDRARPLPKIRKVTSASTGEAAEFVDALYRRIIVAGTYKASSIEVAEAAKVVENTQRDVNIALMNELAMIFDKMGIDTGEVLDAAGTKWNFIPFQPGLVGGHCIGIDPYYLTYRATQLGYHPELTLASRRINDKMALFAANKLMREMAARRIAMPGSRILVLGITFKENCPDLRNTKVTDLVDELTGFNADVDIVDPVADAEEVRIQLGRTLISDPPAGAYDAVVLAVAHERFCRLDADDFGRWLKPHGIVYDLKRAAPAGVAHVRL